MDTQLTALHQAVKELLRACQAVKAASRAQGRRGSVWSQRWNESVLPDPLEARLSAAQARQLVAEQEVLARWKEFTQDYATDYATPELAA